MCLALSGILALSTFRYLSENRLLSWNSLRLKGSSIHFLFDSEESFGPDGISLRGALEAGGP